MSAAGRNAALAAYLGLLQGLLGTTASDEPEGGAGDLDAALAGMEEGASAQQAALLFGSPLRLAATWQWGDAVLGGSGSGSGATTKLVSASDALYEMASMMLASVLAAAREAAALCADSASGVGTSASTQAYRLLREAAGTLDWLAANVLPQLPPTASYDLDSAVSDQ